MRSHVKMTRQLALVLSIAASFSYGFEPMSDSALSEESGAGIAFGLEDFRYTLAPTSYIEAIGQPPLANFKRADARYYGLSITSAGSSAKNYDGSVCMTAGTADVRCPLGNGAITHLASFDNPFLLRVFDYPRISYMGVLNTNRTVLELLGPTQSDSWRFATWAELEVARGGAGGVCDGSTAAGTQPCVFQSQMIVLGKPITKDNKGVALRVFEFEQDPGVSTDQTMGIIYESRLSGDFRFSVNKISEVALPFGVVPSFDSVEGVYARNVDAFLPFGQMHYQAITFDDTQPGSSGSSTANGNFVVSLSQVPDTANVYNDFYSTPSIGCTGAGCGYQRTGRPARYSETHGYVRWGAAGNANDLTSGSLATRRDDKTDGIYFAKCAGCAGFTAIADRPDPAELDTTPARVYGNYTPGGYTNLSSVNLGDSSVEGLLIHNLKITTLGAN